MFKVDVARLAEASLGVLQETQDIRVAYERTDAALDSFSEAVTKVIVPLHQIAANQGFPTWRPSVEYAVVGI